jgi:tripartite-type tricarboxylate transporter receptor subunit TctC
MYRRSVLKNLKCLAVLSGLLCASAWAAYPERAVTLVVPFTPGSGSDIIARIIAPKLSERWKQAVVVDNRPGAGGAVGLDLVAKSAPDGYTIVLASAGGLTANPSLYKQLPYEPLRDFAPITVVSSVPMFLIATPGLGVNTLQELVELAKKKPGEINFGSPGPGSPHHIALELFNQKLDSLISFMDVIS